MTKIYLVSDIVRKNKRNGMLRHTFLRVGEDISLQHFIVPSFKFLMCLSTFLVPYCLLVSTSKVMDGNKGKEQDRQFLFYFTLNLTILHITSELIL